MIAVDVLLWNLALGDVLAVGILVFIYNFFSSLDYLFTDFLGFELREVDSLLAL